ncbi:MAG TPA: molybdopterin-dependent oxidoreductase, partial [Mycobacterium sp.]|nr:molybdopterin-dependent oxidoreductase [Mycobacterium sp.]
MATVEDNRIVDIRGDGDHPVSRGYLCSKGKSMTRVIEDPDRVTTPLKRTEGPGEFAPTDWNQALGDVAERLTRIRNEYGP